MSYATRALARADDARTLADRSLTEAHRTDERLTWLWTRRARPSVVGALVLRFGADQWMLDAQAEKVARDLVDRLRENPALVVQVEGYADALGAPPHNLRLSQLRAEAVVRFLLAQGVELHRLRAIGLGATRPVADNSTLEGRRQNRRAVVRVLDPS
jgi:outer membrane protein OmpA-like peptidoglycan-associated protein